MSTADVDRYLAELPEPKRTTLQALRETILRILPDADEGISYGMPAFRVQGKVVAGFAAFKNHLSYVPHSGTVIPALGDETSAYAGTKSSLHFPVDQPLPAALVERLIAVRLQQIGQGTARISRRTTPPS
jgi:uncharacterized protein YdhG (YjbR/CyaY superfamily)